MKQGREAKSPEHLKSSYPYPTGQARAVDLSRWSCPRIPRHSLPPRAPLDARGNSLCHRYSRERADQGGCSRACEAAVLPVTSTPAEPESSRPFPGAAAATPGPGSDQCTRVSVEVCSHRGYSRLNPPSRQLLASRLARRTRPWASFEGVPDFFRGRHGPGCLEPRACGQLGTGAQGPRRLEAGWSRGRGAQPTGAGQRWGREAAPGAPRHWPQGLAAGRGQSARPHPAADRAYRRERGARINVAPRRGPAALRGAGARQSHAVPAPRSPGWRRGGAAVRAHAVAAACAPDAVLHRGHSGSRARRAHPHAHAAVPQLLLHQPRVLLPDPGVRAHADPPRLLAPLRCRAGRRLRTQRLRGPSVPLPAVGE